MEETGRTTAETPNAGTNSTIRGGMSELPNFVPCTEVVQELLCNLAALSNPPSTRSAAIDFSRTTEEEWHNKEGQIRKSIKYGNAPERTPQGSHGPFNAIGCHIEYHQHHYHDHDREDDNNIIMRPREHQEAVVVNRGSRLEEQQDLRRSADEPEGSAKRKLEFLEGQLNDREIEIKRLEEVIAEYDTSATKQQQQQQDLMDENKRLRQLIDDRKGKIRTYARIRPSLRNEPGRSDIVYASNAKQVIVQENTTKRTFTFGHVFPHSAGQAVVFDEISPLIESFLQGNNVCLFSYGQTGSGKTYTMMGNLGIPEQEGLIPRCIRQIRQYLETTTLTNSSKVETKLSCLEVYNDTLIDLLACDKNTIPKKEPFGTALDGRQFVKKLIILKVELENEAAVNQILSRVTAHRTTGSTGMNTRSSRSHAVYTLYMTKEEEGSKERVCTTLDFVDLAGTEASKSSTNIDETSQINTSLAFLSKLFVDIVSKKRTVHCRDCKLTRLLGPKMKGKGKVCMIFNLSPAEASVPQTLATLRVFGIVKECELDGIQV